MTKHADAVILKCVLQIIEGVKLGLPGYAEQLAQRVTEYYPTYSEAITDAILSCLPVPDVDQGTQVTLGDGQRA